jgi:hypothetical protein
MKLFKFSGIAWGILYLFIGLWTSFTINSVNFGLSWVVLALTFLLPLPLSITAFRLPSTAGLSILSCALICSGILIHLFGIRGSLTPRSIGLYTPHVVFGLAYLMLGKGLLFSDRTVSR